MTLGQGFQGARTGRRCGDGGRRCRGRIFSRPSLGSPKARPLRARRGLRRPEGPLFSRSEPRRSWSESRGDVVDLLRRAAWLERVNPALCVAVGLPNAPQETVASGPGEVEGSSFRWRSGEETWFSLHALLRAVPARSLAIDIRRAAHPLQACRPVRSRTTGASSDALLRRPSRERRLDGARRVLRDHEPDSSPAVPSRQFSKPPPRFLQRLAVAARSNASAKRMRSGATGPRHSPATSAQPSGPKLLAPEAGLAYRSYRFRPRRA